MNPRLKLSILGVGAGLTAGIMLSLFRPKPPATTPEKVEPKPIAQSMMPQKQVARSVAFSVALPPQKTNTLINLVWEAPARASGYVVSWGTNSHSYPWSARVGSGSNYTLNAVGTNKAWYVVIQSTNDIGMVSDYSNEARVPEWPENMVRIAWDRKEIVTLQTSQDFKNWSVITQTNGTNFETSISSLGAPFSVIRAVGQRTPPLTLTATKYYKIQNGVPMGH